MKASCRRKRGPGGFTLVELLVAITIVLIFGAMAAETLREGAAMWRTGYRRSYAYDTSTVIFQQMQDDLSAAASQFWGPDANAYDQNVKFWVDFDALVDSGNNLLARRQWMRFVRAIPDDDVNPLVRNAGTVSGATGWYNLQNPNSPNPPPNLMPLGGKCEVAYMMGLGAADSTTLYRAVLAPIGQQPAGGAPQAADHAGWSFFNADAWAAYPAVNTANDPLSTAPRIAGDATHPRKALPLAQNVIYFEVRLWSQYTSLPTTSPTGWDPSGGLTPFANDGYCAAREVVTPFESVANQPPWPNSFSPTPSGSLYTWNSDRVTTAGTPQFPMTWDQAGFTVLPTPNCDTADVASYNVFPRAVMVVVTIEPPNELSLANPLRIVGPITNPNSTADIPVIGEGPPFNAEWPFVKIDNEWIRVKSVAADTIVVDQRGARGTTATTHNSGERVLVGFTFSRIFNNPAAREYWGQ